MVSTGFKYESVKSKKIHSLIENSNFNKLIIAGPCTFGNYNELYDIAKKLKEMGISYIRAGAFKPRTNPYSFQGLQDKGIECLLRLKKELGIHIVTELMSIEQVRKYANDIDIIQIGSRNMYNYELLKEVGKLDNIILLKRGISATYKEWLLSAEYIINEGNKNVILCERGVRTFENELRNTLDISAIPYIKKNSALPIIVDPSHASGCRYMIEPLSKASISAGADGLIIEVHKNPDSSLCDSKQTIDIKSMKKILKFMERN